MMVEECVPWRERTTGDSQICPSKKSMSLNQETESMSLNQENRYARVRYGEMGFISISDTIAF